MSGELKHRPGGGARVSAVVVSYFTGPVLARCLASLQAEPEVAEIILVDNGNWPGAIESAIDASGANACVRVIAGHGNVGFAVACNLGAKAATGDYLFFLNPDATIEPGGVNRLIADGGSVARPWMIGCKLVGPDGVEQQGSRRATLTPWRAFVEATRLYALAPRHPYFRRFNLHQDPCPKDLTPVPAISGACFFLRRDEYFAIGGMDERYFLHAEDLDFCLRFGKAGGRVYFDPHVEVAHIKSSSRANAMRVEFRKTASILRYFRTHFSEPYPPPFMLLVAGALWGVFFLKAGRRAVTRTVGYAAALPRLGGAGFRRTMQLAARRRSR
jgi:hypothetical protein